MTTKSEELLHYGENLPYELRKNQRKLNVFTDPWKDSVDSAKEMSEWETLLLSMTRNIDRISISQVNKISNIFIAERKSRFKYVNAYTNMYFLRRERRITFHEDEAYISYGYPSEVSYNAGKEICIDCALDNCETTKALRSISTACQFGDVSFITNDISYIVKYIDIEHFNAMKAIEVLCVKQAQNIIENFPEIEMKDCLIKPIFVIRDGVNIDYIMDKLDNDKISLSIPNIVAVASNSVDSNTPVFEYYE